jgi:hypothetical protein
VESDYSQSYNSDSEYYLTLSNKKGKKKGRKDKINKKNFKKVDYNKSRLRRKKEQQKKQ